MSQASHTPSVTCRVNSMRPFTSRFPTKSHHLCPAAPFMLSLLLHTSKFSCVIFVSKNNKESNFFSRSLDYVCPGLSLAFIILFGVMLHCVVCILFCCILMCFIMLCCYRAMLRTERGKNSSIMLKNLVRCKTLFFTWSGYNLCWTLFYFWLQFMLNTIISLVIIYSEYYFTFELWICS